MAEAAPAERFLAAAVQMRSTRSVDENIAAATALIREAAEKGARYVQTPEMTNILERDRPSLFAKISEEAADPSLAAFQALAGELGIFLHIGSLAIRLEGARAANRSFLIGPDGAILASYDKIHMFDVDLAGGESYRESTAYRPGETAILAELPWIRLGFTICYDVRFPALHRALAEAGAGLISIPAAFTRQTGEAHWHVLLKARAIETGSFVVAAAQGGTHEDGRETYGHSLIIAPWGEVLAEAAHDKPGVILAEIDPAKVGEARRRIPALENGRRFVVELPEGRPRLEVVR